MPQIPTENATTIDNLLAAFEGESNANAKYVAFAVKADADGWHGAASLFRAAAQAEQIHAANHARVIRQLGGEACCEIHAVHVKTTLENLKAALAGEQVEIERARRGHPRSRRLPSRLILTRGSAAPSTHMLPPHICGVSTMPGFLPATVRRWPGCAVSFMCLLASNI